MKLNYFSAQTMPKMRLGNNTGIAPKIYFSSAGMVQFNMLASNLAGLETGVRVTLAQDEENPRDWYFFKDEENGFELKLSSDERLLKFNHSALIKAFQGAFGFDDASRNFVIQKDPVMMKGSKTQYWKIIIHD